MDAKQPIGDEIGVAELRVRLADVLNKVSVHRKPVYVTSHGRRVATIVPLAEEAERVGEQ